MNGSLQTRSYEDKDGNKRKVYEIVADNLHFAEGKPRQDSKTDETAPADGITEVDDSEDLPF